MIWNLVYNAPTNKRRLRKYDDVKDVIYRYDENRGWSEEQETMLEYITFNIKQKSPNVYWDVLTDDELFLEAL